MLAHSRAARRGPLIFLIALLLAAGIIAHRSRFLIGLLFENGYPEIIDPVRLLDELGTDDDATTTGHHRHEQQTSPPQLIPKIIHQTYKNASLPEEWQVSQTACKKLHPDFEYMFWTDASALAFIAATYPWFLPTYTSYAYPIQRVDALRYFILHHYGGIYLDLDIEPSRALDPLLQYPAWACRTAPTGISNDALGAAPGHPFYTHVIASLEAYDRHWGLPYVTVMYTTGPLFLSALWEEYIATQGARPKADRVWVLSPDTPYEATYGFFWNHEGGSWHGWDLSVVFWLGRHWVLIVGLLSVGAALGLALAAGWCFGRFGGGGGADRVRRSSRRAKNRSELGMYTLIRRST